MEKFKRLHLKWMAFALIAVLLISACGGDEEAGIESVDNDSPTTEQTAQSTEAAVPTTEENTTAGGDSPLAQLPEAVDGQMSLPVIEGVTGGILFSKGILGGAGTQSSSLYLIRFGENEPRLIAESVNPVTVSVSPDRQKAFYVTSGIRNRRVFIADLNTLAVTDLGRMQGVVAFSIGWTADALVYAEIQIRDDGNAISDFFLVKQDGTGIVDLSPEGLLSGLLVDGSVMLNEVSEDQTALTVNRYLPDTGEQTTIGTVPLDPTNFAVTIAGVAQLLTENGLDFGDTFFTGGVVRVGDERIFSQLTENVPGGIAICGTWEVTQMGMTATDGESLYTIEDTTLLSNLRALPDRSLLLLRWWFEDCDINRLRNDIVRIAPNGDSSVVLTDIDPGTEVNLSFLANSNGQKFDLSPDGRYVFWLGGGLQASYSALNVTDLTTNTTTVLMTQQMSGSSDSFLENEVFSNVFWVE
jgi:hypothetical protein